MMGVWVKNIALVFLIGLLLSACAGFPKPETEGGITYVTDIVENPGQYIGQEVFVEGYVTFDSHYIKLWESRFTSPNAINIDTSKIDGGDRGLEFHIVILKGTIYEIDCEAPESTYIHCGTFIGDYSLIYVN